MTDLSKFVAFKDYQVFAGPDWPSYQDLLNGERGTNATIQQEIEDFIAMMRQTFEETVAHGDVIALANQQRQQHVFFDKHYQGFGYCYVPWETMGVNKNGDVFICTSPSWVPKFVGNILTTNDVFDILNSGIARLIRQEILAKRYYYCNDKICNFFKRKSPTEYQHSPINVDDDVAQPLMQNLATLVSRIPKNLIFDFDYTCNFRCPSCRTELINDNKHHVIRSVNNNIVESIKHLVIDKIQDQPIEIRWCGGEPFISEVYLDLLDYILDKNKPNIQHIIQTNGSYLQKKSDLVQKLLPATKEFRISFDAATSETYHRIRVNGQWDLLLENVKWLRSITKGEIIADFVVQLDNYKEMPAFVELSKQLGIDKIYWQKMWNWGTWPQQDFDNRNILNPAHPSHKSLIELLEKNNIVI